MIKGERKTKREKKRKVLQISDKTHRVASERDGRVIRWLVCKIVNAHDAFTSDVCDEESCF